MEVVSIPDWDHKEAGGHPGHRYGDLGICDCSVTQGGNREHYRHEPGRGNILIDELQNNNGFW